MDRAPYPIQFKPMRSSHPELNEHRSVFCSHYSACLDLALRRGWDDFSCQKCELCHQRATPAADHYALEQPHLS